MKISSVYGHYSIIIISQHARFNLTCPFCYNYDVPWWKLIPGFINLGLSRGPLVLVGAILIFATSISHKLTQNIIRWVFWQGSCKRRQFLYFFFLFFRMNPLAAHNWQKWISRFLTCPSHKIYRVEAVGPSLFNYIKTMIFVNV